jgi:hypothetical protein
MNVILGYMLVIGLNWFRVGSGGKKYEINSCSDIYFLCLTEMSGEGPTYAAVKDILHHASKFHHLMDSERCSICDQNILSCS